VQGSPASSVGDMLAALQPGGEVMVERAEPNWCAGFCGTWVIGDPDDPVGFVERLQAECGGGVYLLRPLRRLDNGQRRYAPGSVRVRVAGAPRAASTAQPPAAAVIDAPVVRERVVQPPSSGFDAFAGVFERVMAPIAQRLAAVESALARPVAPVAAAPTVDLVGELRKFAELRKLARELLGDGGGRDDDDDDDDDEQQQQPLDLESLAAKFLEQKLDAQTQPPPPQQQAPSSGPRLIRNGVDVSSSPPQPASAPPPQPMGAPPPPASAQEAAAQFAAKLGAMPPTDALQFLAEVQQRLPPQLRQVMEAVAQAQLDAQRGGDDDDDDEDDPHAAAFR
jgi:hypothetical protein